jgi:tetratricopeptide (TPR) repeat protein
MATPEEQNECAPVPQTSGRRTPPGRVPPAPPRARFPRKGPRREPNPERLSAQFEREARAEIEKDASNAYQHQWLATLLFEQGRVEEALAFARRAAELAPDRLKIRGGLATTYERFGFHDLASAELDVYAQLLNQNRLS